MKRSLILVLVMWPLVAHADEPCANDHFMRAMDPALGHMACSNMTPITYAATTTGPQHTARVLHSGGAREATEERAARAEVEEIIGRMVTAANSVRMDVPAGIAVYLDPNPTAPENRVTQLRELEAARADHNFARPGECVVAYHYRGTDPRKKFDVVHQLFHCMTWTMWDDARLGQADANWWAEGSAEFFASIAYPGTMTDADAAMFHSTENASLFSRGPDAVVFFDWYATQPGKLKGLIDTVHDKPPGGLMVDLYPDVGANWLEFEEAYFDHTIRSPGGAVVPYPSTPAPPTTTVSASTSVPFRAEPYEIHGAVLEFAAGHAYELDGGAENDFKWKWSEGAAGAWNAPPTIVHTCHQARRYRLVLAAKTREVTKRLRITAREEHEADCPCLVGAWQQTGASLAGVVQRLQARGIRNATCSLEGGGTLLQFTADFNGGETYQDLATKCIGTTMRSDGRSHGTGSFTWSLNSPTQITMASSGGDASTHITVTVRGRSSELDTPMTVGSTAAINFRCSRTDLHLEYRVGASVDTFDYTRVP